MDKLDDENNDAVSSKSETASSVREKSPSSKRSEIAVKVASKYYN